VTYDFYLNQSAGLRFWFKSIFHRFWFLINITNLKSFAMQGCYLLLCATFKPQ